MAPGSIFHHISFWSTILQYFAFQSINQKYQNTLSFIYLYQISLLQVTVKGLTTPLSRWVQVVWLFVQVFIDLCVVSYWIDTMVLKLREILISTLLNHCFLFKGKTNASSRSSSQWRSPTELSSSKEEATTTVSWWVPCGVEPEKLRLAGAHEPVSWERIWQ